MYIENGVIIATAEECRLLDQPTLVVPAILVNFCKGFESPQEVMEVPGYEQVAIDLAETLYSSIPESTNKFLEIMRVDKEFPLVYKDEEPAYSVSTETLHKNTQYLSALMGIQDFVKLLNISTKHGELLAQL